MIAVAFVQWGGHAGRGFTPVREGSLAEVERPFRDAAHALVHHPSGVQQPPAKLGDIAAHPALGLRRVDVPDLGAHWCFSVQVKGGRIGRTGVCQFLFAPVGPVAPADLWASGTAAVVAGEGLIPWSVAQDGLPEAVGPARVPSDAIEPVLRALAAGQERVRLPAAVGEVPAAIAALLRVLPEPVVLNRVWSTYLVEVPMGRSHPHVTGDWPEHLRDNDFAREVHSWLTPTAAVATWHGIDSAERAMDLLVDVAAGGGAMPEYRDLPNMGDLLAAVAHDKVVLLRQDEIAGALDAADERVLRPENSAVLAAWVESTPDGAIDRLSGRSVPAPFEDVVFERLLELHEAKPQAQVLRIPGSRDADPDWFDASVTLVLRRCPTEEDRVNLVRDLVDHAGVPERVRQRAWFLALGLDELDPALADLFPITPEQVAEEVRVTGGLGPLAGRYLLAADDRAEGLLTVLALLGPQEPARAIDLLRPLETATEQRHVLRAVLERHEATPEGFGDSVSTWLLTAWQATESQELRESVLVLGSHALRKQGESPSLDLSLAAVRTAAASQEPAKSFAGFTTVLATATTRLRELDDARIVELAEEQQKVRLLDAELKTERAQTTARVREVKELETRLVKEKKASENQRAAAVEAEQRRGKRAVDTVRSRAAALAKTVEDRHRDEVHDARTQARIDATAKYDAKLSAMRGQVEAEFATKLARLGLAFPATAPDADSPQAPGAETPQAPRKKRGAIKLDLSGFGRMFRRAKPAADEEDALPAGRVDDTPWPPEPTRAGQTSVEQTEDEGHMTADEYRAKPTRFPHAKVIGALVAALLVLGAVIYLVVFLTSTFH
ncbi:hypothetical protein JOD54_004193 [Actinokineospora baliensis]|uniref:hypothetical protein n=1 Tax=Actinokineospora baliensis TaxID=547056 RepID=UPI00195EE4FC|nr:hypothetical protein [Actinokineospora baliensis]MBM7773989.1 hypothetical protein [Actinokineospora baliensis]